MFDRMQYRFMYGYYGFAGWLKSRFTPAGKLALLGLMASGLLAWTPNKTLAYQIAPFLFLLFVFAVGCSYFFSLRLRVQRRLPRMATVGTSISYKCTIENQTGKIQSGLTLAEKFKDTKPSFDQFRLLTLSPQPGRNKIQTILEQDKIRIRSFKEAGASGRHQVLPDLPPQKALEIENSFTPLKRGYLRLAGVEIFRPDPLGLYHSAVTVPCEESLLVIPKIYPAPALRLAGSRKHNQKGVALASHLGDSEEFVALRDYRPGDPLRTIHWNSWAKVGHPVVKQYQDEYFSRYALILDTFTQVDSDLFEEAVSVAASFSANMDMGESLLDLMFVGTESYCFTSGRSLGDTDRILEILATVRSCRDHSFDQLSRLVMSRSALLSGGICVLLSWDETRQALVRHLRSLNIPLMVFVIVEKGAELEIDPGPMKDQADHFHVLERGRIEEVLQSL
jgi:hypothetical protein